MAQLLNAHGDVFMFAAAAVLVLGILLLQLNRYQVRGEQPGFGRILQIITAVLVMFFGGYQISRVIGKASQSRAVPSTQPSSGAPEVRGGD